MLAKIILCSAEPRIICLPTHVINLVINDNSLEILYLLWCFQGKILVGTGDNNVLEIAEKNGAIQVIVSGHGEGQVWGLDRHPVLSQFITASFDGSVCLWDALAKVLHLRASLG